MQHCLNALKVNNLTIVTIHQQHCRTYNNTNH